MLNFKLLGSVRLSNFIVEFILLNSRRNSTGFGFLPKSGHFLVSVENVLRSIEEVLLAVGSGALGNFESMI